MTRSQKRVLVAIMTIIVVIITTLIVGAIAQGYRPDFSERRFKPTGLLAVTSVPSGASVWIDGKLNTATNQTINLTPDTYQIEIKKPGYSTWKKSLKIEKELVVTTDAYLFPLAPDLKSLSFAGAVNPKISPDGTKVVYFTPSDIIPPLSSSQDSTVSSSQQNKNTASIKIIDLTEKSLNHSPKPRILAKIPPTFNIDQTTLQWSPNSRKILLTVPKNKEDEYFILDVGQSYDFTTPPLLDTPSSQVLTTLSTWKQQRSQDKEQQLSKLPKTMEDILQEKCQNVTFSPDETKVLYQNKLSTQIPEKITTKKIIAASCQKEQRELTPNDWYVYDIKEDKNFLILAGNEDNISSEDIQWFPTSRHLLLTERGKKIEIIEYDGTNRTTIYAGPFENSFVFPFPSGKGLLILTSLGSKESGRPHLYAVFLK